MTKLLKRFFSALIFLTFSLASSIQADARPTLDAQELLTNLNALRAANNLTSYSLDATLTKVAQAHADYIAETGILTHYDRNGIRPYQRAMAAGYTAASAASLTEALFAGFNVSTDDILAAWQADDSAAPALLSPDYEDVGIGISAADGKTYYVLIAASQTNAAVSATPTFVESVPTVGTGTSVPNTPLASGEIYHLVRKDEGLWSVAILYGTTIEELKLLNNLYSDDIYEGQRLLVRAAYTPTPTQTPLPATATVSLLSTSTATIPPTLTQTPTATPAPVAPTNLQSGGVAVGGIVLAALLMAGLGAFLSGRKKQDAESAKE
ncbi:MAG: CAP domain-containing protein [Anaerolineales bacterium]|nr:CAP domain-containing protein [Anaerolineales bacterium]